MISTQMSQPRSATVSPLPKRDVRTASLETCFKFYKAEAEINGPQAFDRYGFTYTIEAHATFEDFLEADNIATNNVRAPWAERPGIKVERAKAKHAA